MWTRCRLEKEWKCVQDADAYRLKCMLPEACKHGMPQLAMFILDTVDLRGALIKLEEALECCPSTPEMREVRQILIKLIDQYSLQQKKDLDRPPSYAELLKLHS